MPLFALTDGRLRPFRLLQGGAELYESEIEHLLWSNLEDLLGEPLFPVARQLVLPEGGRPDIVALDKVGRVVVIEIKRGIDRKQISQCLEYAGWARQSNLDEIASHYDPGSERFFTDWQEFTESVTPVVINRNPRLILVAKDMHPRTVQAFDFLVENGVPITFVPVSIYEGQPGERYVDVGQDSDAQATISAIPAEAAAASSQTRTQKRSWSLDGRRFRVGDLLDSGLLEPEDELVWERPNLGQRHEARVSQEGSIVFPDGQEFASPSAAAVAVAGHPIDGWNAWRVSRLGGRLLKDLRFIAIEGEFEPTVE